VNEIRVIRGPRFSVEAVPAAILSFRRRHACHYSGSIKTNAPGGFIPPGADFSGGELSLTLFDSDRKGDAGAVSQVGASDISEARAGVDLPLHRRRWSAAGGGREADARGPVLPALRLNTLLDVTAAPLALSRWMQRSRSILRWAWCFCRGYFKKRFMLSRSMIA